MAEVPSPMHSCSRLVDLPSEVLHRILVHLNPFDLARLSQTCAALLEHIDSSNQLWKQIFEKRWDVGPCLFDFYDPVLRERISSGRRSTGTEASASLATARSAEPLSEMVRERPTCAKAKGKGKAVEPLESSSSTTTTTMPARLFLTDETIFKENHDFTFSEESKRRAVATERILRAKDRPFEFVSTYNQTLRTLLSIARSRQTRRQNQSNYDEDMEEEHHWDAKEAGANARFLQNSLTSNRREPLYRDFVYPRQAIHRLREWQAQHQRDCSIENDVRASDNKPVMGPSSSSTSRATSSRAIDHGEKRDRSSSSASQNKQESIGAHIKGSKRQRTSSRSIVADLNQDNNDTKSEISGAAGNRRRSRRLALRNYPSELQHLLYEHRTLDSETGKEGRHLQTASYRDSQGLRMGRLEDVETVDEQLAAELHVLHGIRPGRPSRDRVELPAPSFDGECHREDDEESNFDEDRFTIDRMEEFAQHEHVMDLPDDMHEPPLGSALGLHGDNLLRGAAREIVYDNARYGPETSYGPLRPWRERCLALDGRRFVDRRREREAEEERQEQQSANSGALVERDDALVEITSSVVPSEEGANSEISVDDGSSEAESDDEDDPLGILSGFGLTAEELVAQLANASNVDDDDESDSEYHSQSDSENSASDNSEAEFFFEIRETAIAASQGLLSYVEAQRLKNAMLHHGFVTGSKGWTRPTAMMTKPSVNNGAQESVSVSTLPNTSTRDVWRMEKRVDWVTVEAIMVVMYCNIRHAALHHGWGTGFVLPQCDWNGKSLMGRDPLTKRLVMRDGAASDCSGTLMLRWYYLLSPPCGWGHSAGDLAFVPLASHTTTQVSSDDEPKNKQNGTKDEESKDDAKPFDWAGVESTWIGTYAFLDWTRWAAFNARDPISRGVNEESGATNTDPLKPKPVPIAPPSLKREREAVGDCLQLRMELLPEHEQRKPFDEHDRLLEELEKGEDDDPRFPRLRFKGTTITFDGGIDPTPRGQVYGSCRPIYATADEEFYRESIVKGEGGVRDNGLGNESRKPRSIVAIHWDLIHRYEGEDRWALSGVQAGPPGTQAPIFGIWGSSNRQEDTSPCGPWMYYKVSERPWREVDELLAEERRKGIVRNDHISSFND